MLEAFIGALHLLATVQHLARHQWARRRLAERLLHRLGLSRSQTSHQPREHR
jgi:hypothetical protein